MFGINEGKGDSFIKMLKPPEHDTSYVHNINTLDFTKLKMFKESYGSTWIPQQHKTQITNAIAGAGANSSNNNNNNNKHGSQTIFNKLPRQNVQQQLQNQGQRSSRGKINEHRHGSITNRTNKQLEDIQHDSVLSSRDNVKSVSPVFRIKNLSKGIEGHSTPIRHAKHNSLIIDNQRQENNNNNNNISSPSIKYVLPSPKFKINNSENSPNDGRDSSKKNQSTQSPQKPYGPRSRNFGYHFPKDLSPQNNSVLIRGQKQNSEQYPYLREILNKKIESMMPNQTEAGADVEPQISKSVLYRKHPITTVTEADVDGYVVKSIHQVGKQKIRNDTSEKDDKNQNETRKAMVQMLQKNKSAARGSLLMSMKRHKRNTSMNNSFVNESLNISHLNTSQPSIKPVSNEQAESYRAMRKSVRGSMSIHDDEADKDFRKSPTRRSSTMSPTKPQMQQKSLVSANNTQGSTTSIRLKSLRNNPNNKLQNLKKILLIEENQPLKGIKRNNSQDPNANDKEAKSNSITLEIDEKGSQKRVMQVPPVTLTLNGQKKKTNFPIILLRSIYKSRPPTIYFPYPSSCHKSRNKNRTEVVKIIDQNQMPKFATDFSYKSIINSFQKAGLIETGGDDWNIYWGRLPTFDILEKMGPNQKINHFPGSKNLGHKDNLWRNYARLKQKYPDDFNFMPTTYLMDSEFYLFQHKQKNAPNDALWIIKPVAASCGQGITLATKSSRVVKRRNFLVSEYIANPHLINGLKYDLRIYVLVTSMDPLRIYLFDDGLVRFATEPYSTDQNSLKLKYKHLTNYSLNKNTPEFQQNKSIKEDYNASKWSLKNLKKKYAELGVNFESIWGQIKDIVIKTLISCEPFMLFGNQRSQLYNKKCFELYGFDILIDSKLKPWLMEVNTSPSLNTDSPIDEMVKTTMISDSLNILGLRLNQFSEKESDEEFMRFYKKFSQFDEKITMDNCMDKLSLEDWEMLFESDEEYFRRGNYELLFPLKENINKYKKYFEADRFNNSLLWKSKSFNYNVLEKITKPEYAQNV